MITVTTNNRPRSLVSLNEIPARARSWFDYLDETEHDSPRLVSYRGAYYDVFDSMVAPAGLAELGWHGYQTETYFSGVVFRLTNDHYDDLVTVGRYYAGDDTE